MPSVADNRSGGWPPPDEGSQPVVRDRNPDESLDAEGIPDLDEQPPGIDVETEVEGLVAPRDHSIAAGSDPAYPNTAAEQERPESVADRAAREVPEDGENLPWRPPDEAVAVGEDGLLEPDLEDGEDVEGAEVGLLGEGEGSRALSPEEAAMRIGGEDLADDVDPSVERAEYLEP